MALSSSIVWEVRSAGGANNGGGFKTGASGTDYSKQNSAQYALTSVTTAAADAILLSASAASDMVGNVARIVSGTNFTVGYYEIISVVAGVSITLDRTCTSAAGASGVVNIGGAVPSIGTLGSGTAGLGAAPGNVIYVKADATYSIGATDTINCPGTSTNPVWIIGYKTTRGDGYQGRNTTTDGRLVTTNFPNYAYQSGFRLNVSSGTFIFIENINFSGAYSGILLNGSTDCHFYACVSDNNSTNSSAACISGGTRQSIVNCDALLQGTTGGDSAVILGSSSMRLCACWIRVLKTSGSCVAVSFTSTAFASNNTILGSGSAAGISLLSGSVATLNNNTIIGFAKGILIASSLTATQFAIGNMITDCATAAIDCGGTGVPLIQIFNRLRDVTTISNGGTVPTNSGNGNVTTDGAAYSDYVNYDGSTNLDVRLTSGSPGAGVCIPEASSMGSRQRAATGGTAGGSYVFIG